MGPAQTASHPTNRTSGGGAGLVEAAVGRWRARVVATRATMRSTRMTPPNAMIARPIVESARNLARA